MKRRTFLGFGMGVVVAGASSANSGVLRGFARDGVAGPGRWSDPVLSLFLCGDVMLGRGIDQVLPHPSDPSIRETWIRDARRYVDIAQRASGPIPRNVPFDYVWGDALEEMERRRPHARIINLETSITRSDDRWPKTINYRMHPANARVLTSAGIDVCVLANNHVLDWGHAGLHETLSTLAAHRIAAAGAGGDEDSAQGPAVLPMRNGGRLLVFAAATADSGVPSGWNAEGTRGGVHRLGELSGRAARRLAALVRRHREPGDRVLFSIHWGGNWGFDVPQRQRDFAHALVEDAGVDIVHGHSSHHVRAVEVHRGRLILYGCGDLLNDYEGIDGHDDYRGELGLMYFPVIDAASGRLRSLTLVPTRTRRFRIERIRVERAHDADWRWMARTLEREYARFGASVVEDEGAFALRWKDAHDGG